MDVRKVILVAVPAALLILATCSTAMASAASGSPAPRATSAPTSIVISDAGSTGYSSSLTIQFSNPVSESTVSKIKSSLQGTLSASPHNAGPTGEFLVCNKAHNFSDSDGTFSIQHACGGTTGPWGFRQSAGLCAIVVSPVSEPAGMAWTRNGTRQGNQAPHSGAKAKECGNTFHGTFNPEHDFDSITYNDHFTFEIEVSGETGSADLDIDGSFYSAPCTNPSVCH